MRTPRPQQHRSSPRAARGASAALAVAALCGAALTLRPPRAAQAKQCSNPCQVADGALCASLYAAAGGVLPEQVLPQAAALAQVVTRGAASVLDVDAALI